MRIIKDCIPKENGFIDKELKCEECKFRDNDCYPIQLHSTLR